MPELRLSTQPRTIVIPRQLEDYFYERLTSRFAGRDDVVVVVDRRRGERRNGRWVSEPSPPAERRRGDRRASSAAWSLTEMPYAAS